MIIKLIIYGILMMVSGYCIFKIEYRLRKWSIINLIEDNLKHDESIVCEDAIVVCDSNGEFAWYDANNEIESLSQIVENKTKDNRNNKSE